MYAHTVGSQRYHFRDLRTLLAKATPARSGDALAGLTAESAEERVAAQMRLQGLTLVAQKCRVITRQQTAHGRSRHCSR